MICKDPKLPEDQQEFVIPYDQAKNMICTTPDDFQVIQEWIERKCKV